MKFLPLKFSGCYQVLLEKRRDERGSFIKFFRKSQFQQHSLDLNYSEEYFTVSKKDVIRGLHFQTPPHAINKLVYCIEGSVVNVIVDMRSNSSTYGCYEVIELNSQIPQALYLPVGIANGFCVLSDLAIMGYKCSSEYCESSDSGILWSSIGYSWPIQNPIISERDKSFCKLDNYTSPFA